MNQKKTSNKLATQISAKAEKRIVDVSLRHPDFGAHRLVRLLKKQRLDISASRVYGILKRHKLQTRALRQAKLKKQAKKPKLSPKKSPVKIPAAVEERIVELSLKNPDYGAKIIDFTQFLGVEAQVLAGSAWVYHLAGG